MSKTTTVPVSVLLGMAVTLGILTKAEYDKISKNANILLTHGPAGYLLDKKENADAIKEVGAGDVWLSLVEVVNTVNKTDETFVSAMNAKPYIGPFAKILAPLADANKTDPDPNKHSKCGFRTTIGAYGKVLVKTGNNLYDGMNFLKNNMNKYSDLGEFLVKLQQHSGAHGGNIYNRCLDHSKKVNLDTEQESGCNPHSEYICPIFYANSIH